MNRIIGTGIAFPLGTDRRGSFAMASGEDDVEQAIELILATAPGERPMRPEFGCSVHDFVFDRIDGDTLGRIENAVRAALDRWEPRIDVDAVVFDTGRGGELLIEVQYTLRSTSDARNLVFPFYVIPEDEDER